MNGKLVLVTGATAGIGTETALALGRLGARLVLASRNEAQNKAVAERVRSETGAAVRTLPLDLADLDSVRSCAAQFLAWGEPLHVLVNNAGLAGIRGATKQGFELAFGVNHLGHFLLARLLEDALERGAAESNDDARIVLVSSRAHFGARRIDFDSLRKPTASRTAWPEYMVSKLCNVLHARALAPKLAQRRIRTYAVHPGVVASDLWRHLPGFLQPAVKFFMITSAEGARTSVHCTSSRDAGTETGLYYEKEKPRSPSKTALDDGLAEELFRQSEAMIS